MSGQTLSATDAFLDAVEELCLGDVTLGDASMMATTLHDAGDLATVGAATVSRLLHVFRARVGSRSAEWWTATLEGSKVTALPANAALDILVMLAADAGGVALPDVAGIERAAFLPAHLQLATVIVLLIHFYGQQSAQTTLQLLRNRSATTGV